jgi:ketosteroid isomerase-like protein
LCSKTVPGRSGKIFIAGRNKTLSKYVYPLAAILSNHLENTMKQLLIASLITLSAAGSAIASPATDAAKAHFAAVASHNTEEMIGGYADNAVLEWVGGPLDGMYSGKEAIRGTWEKFAKATGPLKMTVDKLEESANPKGATVTANVQFEGKAPIKVRYVLTYRDGKLVDEIWQIDPKLAMSGY